MLHVHVNSVLMSKKPVEDFTTLFIPLPKNNDGQMNLYCTYVLPLFKATNIKFPRASLPSTRRTDAAVNTPYSITVFLTCVFRFEKQPIESSCMNLILPNKEKRFYDVCWNAPCQ